MIGDMTSQVTSKSKIKGKRFTVKSNEAASKPPKMDHTSEELEDKGNEISSMDSVNQKIQEAKEKKRKTRSLETHKQAWTSRGHWKLGSSKQQTWSLNGSECGNNSKRAIWITGGQINRSSDLTRKFNHWLSPFWD